MTSVIAGPSNRRSNCFKSYERPAPRRGLAVGEWNEEHAHGIGTTRADLPKLRRWCCAAGVWPVGAHGGLVTWTCCPSLNLPCQLFAREVYLQMFFQRGKRGGGGERMREGGASASTIG